MIDRSEYESVKRTMERIGREIERSINFIRIFTPETSSTSIIRTCNRLQQSCEDLAVMSKQLRARLDSPDPSSPLPPQAQGQALD